MKQARSILKCIPGIRFTLAILAASLIFGVLAKGFHAKALFGLLLAIPMLVLFTLGQYYPKAFDSYISDGRYSPGQMNAVLTALENVTLDVERDARFIKRDPLDPLVTSVVMARQTLKAFGVSERPIPHEPQSA